MSKKSSTINYTLLQLTEVLMVHQIRQKKTNCKGSQENNTFSWVPAKSQIHLKLMPRNPSARQCSHVTNLNLLSTLKNSTPLHRTLSIICLNSL